VQQPRPPIWVGGNSTAAMQRASTLDGWAPFPASPAVASAVRTTQIQDHAALGAAIERFREIAPNTSDVCFTPFTHPAHKDVVDPAAFVDETRVLAAVGVTWLAFHLPAPSTAAFCDVVSAFGRDAIAKVHA
jgi:hypothetical protein